MRVLGLEEEAQDSRDAAPGTLHSELAETSMYRRIMAFDFDGTLVVNGDVPPEVETALEQCRDSGHVLFLVTGQRSYQGEELREALTQVVSTHYEELRQLR